MIKIYGMKTCPYCDFLKPQIEGKQEFEYFDIGSNVMYMHEFMSMRDNEPIFDRSKAIGDIGIPCFVLEDGSITLDPAVVGLVEYQEGSACSLDGKGC